MSERDERTERIEMDDRDETQLLHRDAADRTRALRGERADRPESGRHPVNVGHLVMGLAFAGIVVVWWFVQADLVDGDDIRWLLPLPWVFAGAAGLLAIVLAGRTRNRTPHGTDLPEETR